MEYTKFIPHGKLDIQRVNRIGDTVLTGYYHDSYKIFFVIRGSICFYYDYQCYQLDRGDVILLKPFEIHHIRSRGESLCEGYVLNFQDMVFSSILNMNEQRWLVGKIKNTIIHLPEEEIHKVYENFVRMETSRNQSGFLTEKLVYVLAFQLLMSLIPYIRTTLNADQMKNFEAVINYMNDHYREKITIDILAEISNVSKYHFCRLFRRVMGTTAMEYLTAIRIAKVYNMLVRTEQTIDEIARNTGFTSAANLARVFKKMYGISPREFRKKEHEK